MAATPPPGQGEGGVLWLAGPGSYTVPFPLSEDVINTLSVHAEGQGLLDCTGQGTGVVFGQGCSLGPGVRQNQRHRELG